MPHPNSALRVLIILPTYDEADNVMDIVRQVLSQDAPIDVLVVDDNSPDGTGDLVAKASRGDPHIHLLRRPGKLGLGTAYLAGFKFGIEHGFDRILTMDCDFSHNPKYLPAMLAAMDRYDMVLGSRYVKGGGIENWPAFRRALSKFANFYARTLLRLPIYDITAGFRGYRREVLETVDPFAIRASGYSFLEEMVWRVNRCGFTVGEIPIVFEQRKAGKSKIDPSEMYYAAWHVLLTAIHPPALPEGARERVRSRVRSVE